MKNAKKQRDTATKYRSENGTPNKEGAHTKSGIKVSVRPRSKEVPMPATTKTQVFRSHRNTLKGAYSKIQSAQKTPTKRSERAY